MTLTYELCVKLKAAGFPQADSTPRRLAYLGMGDRPEDTIKSFFYRCEDKHVFIPTLSELIDACGEGFMSLRKVWDQDSKICNWIAESDTTPVICTIGKTPEEAVARLYLELNKHS